MQFASLHFTIIFHTFRVSQQVITILRNLIHILESELILRRLPFSELCVYIFYCFFYFKFQEFLYNLGCHIMWRICMNGVHMVIQFSFFNKFNRFNCYIFRLRCFSQVCSLFMWIFFCYTGKYYHFQNISSMNRYYFRNW